MHGRLLAYTLRNVPLLEHLEKPFVGGQSESAKGQASRYFLGPYHRHAPTPKTACQVVSISVLIIRRETEIVEIATSALMQLRFAKSKCTFSHFEALDLYLEAHGRPVAFDTPPLNPRL